MKSGQRIIKYLAIALAIFIIVSIVSSIFLGLNIFSNLLGLTKEADSEIANGEMIGKTFDSTEITNIKIELAYSTLTIKEGENFAVETNTNKIESKQNNNELIVKEENINVFTSDKKRNITIFIPKDTILNKIEIEAGAGEIKVEKLHTEDLELEVGAGKATLNELIVTRRARIEGGAGKMEILSGEINNLDLEMGIGSFTIKSSLVGNNQIEAGIGKLDLNLTNGLDNYTIRANKGIGSIKIDGKEVSGNVEYGEGETKLKLEGGIGSIEIN